MKSILALVFVFSLAGSVQAAPEGGGFSVVPYQGSVLEDEQVDEFNESEWIIGADKETQRLEGRLIRLKYKNPKGRSTLEIERNYRDALTAHGLSIDFICAGKKACGNPSRSPSWNSINGINLGIDGDIRYFTGRLVTEGSEVHVAVAINRHVHYVHTLEKTAMQTGLVSVERLATELERVGKVELQGIYFDTGKAILRSESREALAQVATLLDGQPALRLAVVGHTDSRGDPKANQVLSQARADAVRQTLIDGYGIEASRLMARGMGSAQPVSDNATAEGRARNRRVGLVRE
jgi:outer membrane protein OmpA-like peptidoglycan-associated protein